MMATQKAEALFDFEPTAEVELKMQKGEVVTVKRMSVGDGWWEGELNGKRGLFPSSFVKLLPAVHEPVDLSLTPPTPLTPLTPHSTKKAFMETMLAPEPSTLDEIYDEERAIEMFVPGYTEVAIKVGPKWKGRPPTLTIVVKEPQPRLSGMKHATYDVDTKELGSCVTRKYKQFLWLYDRLAENFPCISLPPLPVKQCSGRRKGLDKFLQKVALHPVLGCTKFLKVFLSDKDAKPDKEWKIGKHLSHLSHNIKLPKTSRKLFHAPVYCTVKYPPYNVPISQLASIEKFSRFSRLLETNVNTLHTACRGVSMSQRDMMSNINLLAKDIKSFAKGVESTRGAQRRKLQAKVSISGVSSVPLPPTSIHSSFYATATSGGDQSGAEESSGGEDGEGGPQWNWRDDERFNSMVGELLDLASGMQRTSRVFQDHQEAMESQVMETLQEYSGVINTLPGLVRLHEEAMEYYESSKNKDSKKEAEEVRQNCETLNNILLAEFDYFSNHLVEDFQAMMQRFLLRQVDFHKQLANEWDVLHTRYMERISRRKSDTPIHVISTSPTSLPHKSTSASHPHLHNLHPLHPLSSSSQRTPSDALSSSGGSYGTSRSQDDVVSSSVIPDSLSPFSQSQSHPNIHSIGLSKSSSGSSTHGMDSRSTLTNSDTHAPPADSGPPANSEGRQGGSNYINLNIDELTVQPLLDSSGNEVDLSRRLKSLSPLEQSIERELEKSHHSLDKSSDSDDYQEPGSLIIVGTEGGEKADTQLHQYANWQFAQMNEKSQKMVNTPKPLLNGGPKSVTSDRQGPQKPPRGNTTIPRKPLKPPSPFKLQDLSDLTALDHPHSSAVSAVSPSSRIKETFPQRNLHVSGAGGSEQAVGKAQNTSKLHETPAEYRNVDQLFPSQLSGKPRSYTTTHFMAKRKPILPPASSMRTSMKAHSKMPAMKEIVGTIHEKRETLERSGEQERSFDKDGSSPPFTSSRSMYSTLGREPSAPATGTAASSKMSAKPTRQSSPSNELMRKLSQRRQRLEQQLTTTNKHTSSSTTSSGVGDGSSRCTSTSSTQSELVCTYHTKRSQEDSPVDGPEGSAPVDVELRSKEDANLAKYGIMEDIEGGSFVI